MQTRSCRIESLIGLRVKVFWGDDAYCGTVTKVESFKDRPLFVVYDDGDKKWEAEKDVKILDDFNKHSNDEDYDKLVKAKPKAKHTEPADIKITASQSKSNQIYLPQKCPKDWYTTTLPTNTASTSVDEPIDDDHDELVLEENEEESNDDDHDELVLEENEEESNEQQFEDGGSSASISIEYEPIDDDHDANEEQFEDGELPRGWYKCNIQRLYIHESGVKTALMINVCAFERNKDNSIKEHQSDGLLASDAQEGLIASKVDDISAFTSTSAMVDQQTTQDQSFDSDATHPLQYAKKARTSKSTSTELPVELHGLDVRPVASELPVELLHGLDVRPVASSLTDQLSLRRKLTPSCPKCQVKTVFGPHGGTQGYYTWSCSSCKYTWQERREVRQGENRDIKDSHRNIDGSNPRTVKGYVCSKCGLPKKGHTCSKKMIVTLENGSTTELKLPEDLHPKAKKRHVQQLIDEGRLVDASKIAAMSLVQLSEIA